MATRLNRRQLLKTGAAGSLALLAAIPSCRMNPTIGMASRAIRSASVSPSTISITSARTPSLSSRP